MLANGDTYLDLPVSSNARDYIAQKRSPQETDWDFNVLVMTFSSGNLIHFHPFRYEIDPCSVMDISKI